MSGLSSGEITPETGKISLRGVSKWYGPVIGVNEVSLEIGAGITGLLGPNGAGKSTLMNLVTGQLKPSLGDVRVLGSTVRGSPWARRRLGFVPETDGFFEEMTGLQFVRTMARLSGLSLRQSRARADEALEKTGMMQAAGKKLRACSKGMRQRLKLAQALVHEPEVLVLDEPLSGIDPAGRTELLGLFGALRDEGRTLVISTHILHELEEVSDRIVLMARGRILAAGTLSRIRELLAEYPLTVRITTDRARALGSALVPMGSVAGISIEDGHGGPGEAGDLILRVRRPEEFFREIIPVILELGANVSRLEPLDTSAEAVFDYLVGGASGPFGGGGA